MQAETPRFGVGDASFQAAGGASGLRLLVETFYRLMASDERFRTIVDMHPRDLATSIDKLALFLGGWLGGPRMYQSNYGSISIPLVHEKLAITVAEHDQWLTCMAEAIEQQGYSDQFSAYLHKQLRAPAASVLKRCAEVQETRTKTIPSTVKTP